MSDQPEKAIIWQSTNHSDAPLYCLDWSKRLHTIVMDIFLKGVARTQSAIQKCKYNILIHYPKAHGLVQILINSMLIKQDLPKINMLAIAPHSLMWFLNIGNPHLII
jgi:hypothetical protein